MLRADTTADQPMPSGAVFTRPNKSVTVATRISPEDLADIERQRELGECKLMH